MKRIYLLLSAVIVLVATLWLPSCQKLPYLSAKVADENFKALYILAVHGQLDEDNPDSQGFLILAADSSKIENSPFLAIVIRGEQAGTYTLETLNDTTLVKAECMAFYFPNGSADTVNKYVAYNGYVELTDVDMNANRINGKFQFDLISLDGKTRISITNGTFGNLIYISANDILSTYFNYND